MTRSTFRPAISLLLGIAGVFLLYLYVSADGVQRVPGFSWAPDARIAYDLSWTSEIDIHEQTFSVGKSSATAAASAGKLHVSGVLNLRVHAVKDDQVLVSMQLFPVEVTGGEGNKQSAALAATFSRVALVRFAKRGHMLEVQVPSASEGNRSLEGLLRALQVVLPPAGAVPENDRWRTMEEDLTGRAPVEYACQPDASIKRRRMGYAGASAFDGISVSAEIPQSQQTLTLADDCWLQNSRQKERVRVLRGRKPWFVTNSSFALTRRTEAPDPSAPLFALPVDFAQARMALARKRDTSTAVSPDDKLPLDAILLAIKEEKKINGADPHVALWEYLRTHPEACARIRELLREEEGENDTWNPALIHALENAGHTVAQKTLLSIATDASAVPLNRMRALAALGGIEKPTVQTRKALRELWETRGSTPQEQEYARVTALALGAMADAARPHNPFVSGELVDYVTKQLQALPADATHDRISLLGALGNGASTATLPVIQPFLSSANPQERVAAVRALRGMDDPKSLASIVQRVEAEEVTQVREQAAKVLSGRTATPALLEPAVKLLEGEASPAVRGDLAHYLGRNRQVAPDAALALAREIVSRESSPAVLKVLFSYFTPAELGVEK